MKLAEYAMGFKDLSKPLILALLFVSGILFSMFVQQLDLSRNINSTGEKTENRDGTISQLESKVTDRDERVSSLVRYEYIANRTYRTMEPGAEGMFYGGRQQVEGFHVDINSEGLRGPDLSEQKTEQRILVLGDAYTFGRGVNESERFTEVLEEKIETSGKEVRVINAGVPGFGLEDYRRFLEIQGMRYEPDLVIVTTALIDRAGIDQRHIADDIRDIRDNESLTETEKLRKITEVREQRREVFVGRNYSSINVKDDIKAIDRLTGERCTLMYLHDSSLDHGFWPQPYSERLIYVDRNQEWLREDDLTLPDGYPNERGHRLHAEAIYRAILELPEKCDINFSAQ